MKTDENLAQAARPHYAAIKQALRAAVDDLGRDVVIGMCTTMLLRLYTDQGRPASLALAALAGALAGQKARVSLEDVRMIERVVVDLRAIGVGIVDAPPVE
jgi:hypothetical protein